MLSILKTLSGITCFFAKTVNRIFLWLCPSLAHISKTALRVFINEHLLLVCLQKFTIPAATSLAKHFNFPTWANSLSLSHISYYQDQALHIIYCNKEVLTLCVAIYFFHTYLQFLRKLQMDTLINRIWYFCFKQSECHHTTVRQTDFRNWSPSRQKKNTIK